MTNRMKTYEVGMTATMGIVNHDEDKSPYKDFRVRDNYYIRTGPLVQDLLLEMLWNIRTLNREVEELKEQLNATPAPRTKSDNHSDGPKTGENRSDYGDH